MAKLRSVWVWIRVVRLKFFLAGIPSIILGTAIAWHRGAAFNPLYFALALCGVVFAMAGCYTFNEYFDFKSGVDTAVRPEDITPFSGGSRVLPDGLIQPYSVFKAGLVFWTLAFAIGVYLALMRGWVVLLLAFAGLFTGAFYTSPPFKWAYRGLGEVLIGVTYGPLITLGSYYVQLATLRQLEYVIMPSLIPGLLITAVIWINEFPDYHADRKMGKKNLVVRLGRARASVVYAILLIAAYVLLLTGVLLRMLPLATLIALATLPLAYRNAAIARKSHDDPRKLTPAMSGTILLFVSTTSLLALGYLLATW
ncbi:1,4-dihydroxy-2-naphthoate octaprenyltransferase [Candidatus Geothermarchaeota archaeon ex4572_27]|nr:MAG: 1,4-dihydroxy-2-naphthoate octaprenyltransferase [Candidatus Geothermarchaeota archaeon ex4572_27]